jgi:acetyl-CoA carboxylase beta subunit
MSTPRELLQAYEEQARSLPRPWRWWWTFKAQRARNKWNSRRDAALEEVFRKCPDCWRSGYFYEMTDGSWICEYCGHVE